MRLTRFGFHGVVFYLALFSAFYASPYSNLFFLLLAFLTLQGCLTLLAAPRNVSGLALDLAELQPVAAGDAFCLCAELKAKGRQRFGVSLRLELEGAPDLVAEVDHLASSCAVTFKGAALDRGCYKIRRIRAESSYPLGFLLVRRELAASGELVVFPRPKALQEARSSVEALDELLHQDGSGQEDLQPAGLRDHRDGDDQRHIHWRASARHGRLVMREWEQAGGQGLEVLLDRRCEASALEEALSIISAMVGVARANKETLALHSQSLSATFGAGHRPWCEVLRFLAETQTLPLDGPTPPPVAPSVARLPSALSHA